MSKGFGPGALEACPAPHARVGFSGGDGEFRRIVIRGTLLELVTFGFYRFWLATNIRRHLWTNTSVEEDALEYTGTGRELLIGFLFALTILIPIYLASFAISIEAERWKAFAGLPFGVAYYGFWQFAIYRARRYRLTRTLWRGVRFWMTGSGWAYMARALGWTLLTVLTLGIAYPWREAALERYKLGHTFYGDLPGRFEGDGWVFFKRGWRLWLLLLGLFGFILVYVLALRNYVALSIFAVPIAVGSFFLLCFIYPAFKAVEWKWWAEGLRFGDASRDVRFASNLRPGALATNFWNMIGVCILVVIVAIFTMIGINIVFAVLQPWLLLPARYAVITCYLATVVVLGVVWRIYMGQRVWKIVVSSISLENLAAVDHVVAKSKAASAIGEGLADSLDVAGF
ncbi:MAG TPA: DUF898 family protein [Methylocella sp.]|nr:DUF898 family protein [Methylocella sp.]